MSRQKREQRIKAQREVKASKKKERVNSPSGKSDYAKKKEAQARGQHPRALDEFKPLSSEERHRILFTGFEAPPLSLSPR